MAGTFGGVSPVGRTASQIYSKFTIVNDEKNKITAKTIEAQQKKIIKLELRKQAVKEKMSVLNKKETQQYKLYNTQLNDLTRNIEAANTDLEKMNKAFEENGVMVTKAQKATWAYTAALTGLTTTLLKGIKLNIEYVENLNVIYQLFGDNTDAVLKWSETTRKSFGLARVSALQYVATLKAFTKSAGIDDTTGSLMSIVGVQLAADLASFRNVSFDTAFRAIVSGLAGISRTLRYNFGVDIGEEALQERFGTVGSSQAEKIIQRFVLLLERTQYAVGDFSRTKSSPANQLRLLNENFKEFAFLISGSLLPMVNMSLHFLNSILEVLIRMNKMITFIGGALTIFNIGRAFASMFSGGGFLNVLTFGISSKIGKAFAIVLQGVLLTSLVGAIFGGREGVSKTIETPQTSTSYLPDDVMNNLTSQAESIGGGVTINIAGNATEESVQEMVYQTNLQRMKGTK